MGEGARLPDLRLRKQQQAILQLCRLRILPRVVANAGRLIIGRVAAKIPLILQGELWFVQIRVNAQVNALKHVKTVSCSICLCRFKDAHSRTSYQSARQAMADFLDLNLFAFAHTLEARLVQGIPARKTGE